VLSAFSPLLLSNTTTTPRERTIALYRSSDTQVLQSRAWLPDAIGGVIWFGAGAAHGTAYIPCTPLRQPLPLPHPSPVSTLLLRCNLPRQLTYPPYLPPTSHFPQFWPV
jgi:hypothetical protein